MDSVGKVLEQAKALIKEGKNLIDIRQKHIKIANRSEFGWATVVEYEEDELAENSDDDKRLFRQKGGKEKAWGCAEMICSVQALARSGHCWWGCS